MSACGASSGPGDGAVGDDTVAAQDGAACVCPPVVGGGDSGALPYCQSGTVAWTANHCGELTGPLPPPELPA